MKLILASASPRRKELLGKIGLEFDVIPAKGEEIVTKTMPWEMVEELSFQKAKEIADMQTEECIVIGSDTIAAKGGDIIRETFGHFGNEQYAQVAYEVARYHHEKWNGTGYPNKIAGIEIPLCARFSFSKSATR